MSIVCAKNFAKFIGRPHRTRVPPRLETQTCRRALIAARRTANAVTRARRLHTRPKTLFVSLKKPAEIRRGAANRNTISILIPSPRTIIPCSSAVFRAERSICNTNRIQLPAQSVGTGPRSTKRELRMNLVRGQARSSSLMNCSAYLKTLLISKRVFRRVIPSSKSLVRV